NEVGPVSDSSETPDLVVYINLTDKAGGFANTWFYAAKGIQNQLLDVGIAAINGRKDVEVAATAPLPGNQPYTQIGRIYGLQPQPPEAPTEFHQISLSPAVGNAGLAVLVVGWKDNSSDEDSFVVRYSGTRAGSPNSGGGKVVGANSVTASLSLIPEYRYDIHVAAVNSVGETPSNAITVTVPPALPSPEETATVSLERQIMDGPVTMLGAFPSFGVVPPGRVLQIHNPQIGFADTFLAFVKLGHSSEEFPDSNAFVPLTEGQSTTPAQMTAIFGVATPPYSTTNPINFVAVLGQPLSDPLPSWVDIEITIQPD
ncbi:MAG: hypothetical protein WBL63_24235, partial [Candidatus Acidiferrum sp.]